MRSEIRRIVKQTGITAVYVTHDQKEALSMADGIAVMRLGKLQQTGKPAELYRKPVSRFVADFIGESNFLPGTVEKVEDGRITVQTPAGKLIASRSAQAREVAAQQKVVAAFRPEAVEVSRNGAAAAGGINQLRGRRLSTTYLGEIAEHVIEIAGQPVKAFELNPQEVHGGHSTAGEAGGGEGEEMTVSVEPDHVMLVSE
jgi:iron(III) transport system ATP-binding protein